EGLHTYIAASFRVHNESVLSHVPKGASVYWVGLDEKDIPRDVKYTRADGADVFLDGTNDAKGNTIKVKEKVTYPAGSAVGDGATITQQILYDTKGKVTSQKV